MTPFNRSRTMDRAQAAGLSYSEGLRQAMLGMYNYVASGLLLSAIIAYVAGNSPAMLQFLYGSGMGQMILFAPVLMLLGTMFMGIDRMSKRGLQIFFWAFVSLKGLSLSYVVAAYPGADIVRALFITAIVFGGLSLYGYQSKRDMTSFGAFLGAGAMVLLVAMLVHLGMAMFGSPSSAFGMVISVLVGFLVLGLTVYETWQFKRMYFQLPAEMLEKAAIWTALSLYINAVILFQYILRFTSSRD